jgi:peptide/nickel transport system permease protein
MSYVVRRLLHMLPVLFLASIPVFLIIRLAEGDPVMMLLGVEATRETVQAMRERLGLDQPLWLQYWKWITGVLVGDLGRSVMSDFAVADLLRQRLPATFSLAVVAACLGSALAFPAGIVAALRRGGWFDAGVTALTSVAISIPHFWLGILLVLLFAVKLGWLPAGGYVAVTTDPVKYLKLVTLPAVTLALYIAAILARFARTSMSEVLLQDYIRTARSKGLPPGGVILKHALRNALIPAVTVLGVQFGRLMAGTIIVEVIFAWPGLGQLIMGAINNRDYTVIQGCLLVFIVMVVVSNLVTDVLYSVIDPRISLGAPAR